MYIDSSDVRLVTVKSDGSVEILYKDQSFMVIPEEKVDFEAPNLGIKLNLFSTEVYLDSGDLMTITDFIDCCECGGFIDYDGFADELVINDKIVWSMTKDYNSFLYPSEVLEHREELLQLESQHEGLKIVWYNK